MNLAEFVRRLETIGPEIKESFGEKSGASKKVFEALEKNEKRIFKKQSGPDEEWPKITVISYITRKNLNKKFTEASSLFKSAAEAKPIQDTGKLFRQATSDAEGAIRKVKTDAAGELEFIFGTSKGAKHQEGGRLATGIDSVMAQRARDRAPSGSARNMVEKMLTHYSDNRGKIPQRKFVYLTEEGFSDMFDAVFDGVVGTLEEVFDE